MNRKELNSFEKQLRNQRISDITLSAVIILAIFFYFALHFCACADDMHLIKDYMTHQDADYWYHAQTLSNGSNTVHKVRKPRPPNPYISRKIIATNDLPVQVQYVYRVLLQDLTVVTNYVNRPKTARERTVITLDPIPALLPPDPRKTDALGQARKQYRKAAMVPLLAADPGPEPLTHKTMARPDRITNSKVVDNQIRHTHVSGKITTAPLKRAHTARVKSIDFAPPTQEDIDRGDVHINHGHGPNHRKPR